MTEPALPATLAAKPNVPLCDQTLEQLRAERDYWVARVESYTCWGAGLKFADSCRAACESWIARREREADHG